MEIMDNRLNQYLNASCEAESPLLQKINRETHLMEVMPHMLSGHHQGRLLSMLSKLQRPTRILEIGTFTGYATLCLAEGLSADGLLHTIDINAELEERVLGYFQASPYGKQIRQHIGKALEIIPELEGFFDLVFIDADKRNNLAYYELIIDRMTEGGLILIDNVLWKGKVLDESPDKQTREIQELNQKIQADPRIEKLILPVRDGLYMLRKR